MSEAISRIVINIPVAQAWDKLRNLELAHHYVPGIMDTKITTDLREGVGASRNVYQKGGRFLQETVTEWKPGEGFTIRLHKGEKDAPFKGAFFRYRLSDNGGGTTLFEATMGYQPPLGAFGKGLDVLLLNRIITGVIGDVAASMKHYYETGQTPTKEQIKAIRKRG